MAQNRSLQRRVEACDGLAVVTLGQLRDEVGAMRLGKHVLSTIQSHLSAEGLGAFPRTRIDPAYNVQPNQDDEVRLYRLGSSIAELVECIENPTQAGDEVLLETTTGAATEIVRRIRELVSNE